MMTMPEIHSLTRYFSKNLVWLSVLVLVFVLLVTSCTTSKPPHQLSGHPGSRLDTPISSNPPWPQEAPSQPPKLLVLGDSFSSAVGDTPPSSGPCRRSNGSWAVLLANKSNVPFENLACAGYKINDVLRSLNYVQPGPIDIITISVSGNDANFSELAISCAVSDCVPALTKKINSYAGNIPANNKAVEEAAEEAVETGNSMDQQLTYSLASPTRKMIKLFTTTVSLAPTIVMLYPYLMSGQSNSADPVCSLFSPEERALSTKLIDAINKQISIAAEEAGAVTFYVDFTDHGACSTDPWIHSPAISPDALHPTHVGYEILNKQAYSVLADSVRKK